MGSIERMSELQEVNAKCHKNKINYKHAFIILV